MRGSTISARIRRGRTRGFVAAQAQDFKQLVRRHQAAHRRRAFALDPLRFFLRGAQADADVVGDMAAADRNGRRIINVAVHKDRDVGRPAADVGDADAQFFFIFQQHGFGGRNRLQHGRFNAQAGFVDALGDVLQKRHRAGDDMRLHFQPRPGHADGVAYPALAVNGIRARDGVNDLAVRRQHDDAALILHPRDVFFGDLAVGMGDGDHAARVQRGDMLAGDAHDDPVNLVAGHGARFFHAVHDGLGGAVNVNDDAFADAAGQAVADAHNVDAARLLNFRDNRANFGRPDV